MRAGYLEYHRSCRNKYLSVYGPLAMQIETYALLYVLEFPSQPWYGWRLMRRCFVAGPMGVEKLK